MKKSFDKFLEQIDEAASDIDGRTYNPRREYIKNELSELIRTVSNDAGQEYTQRIRTRLKRGHVPTKSHARRIALEVQKEYETPADSGGKYSLYRDDY